MITPIEWKNGSKIRAYTNYKVRWKRLAMTFPELEIWLIDIQNEILERYGLGEFINR